MNDESGPALVQYRIYWAKGALGIGDSELRVEVPSRVRPIGTPKTRLHGERTVHVVHLPLWGRKMEASVLLKDEFGALFVSPLEWSIKQTVDRINQAGYVVELHSVPRLLAIPAGLFFQVVLWDWSRRAGWR